jgi:hypothetical protein
LPKEAVGGLVRTDNAELPGDTCLLEEAYEIESEKLVAVAGERTDDGLIRCYELPNREHKSLLVVVVFWQCLLLRIPHILLTKLLVIIVLFEALHIFLYFGRDRGSRGGSRRLRVAAEDIHCYGVAHAKAEAVFHRREETGSFGSWG